MQTSDLYDSVTKSIIADLEKGAVPWVKPRKGGKSGGIVPINAATRRHYMGIKYSFYGRPATSTATPRRSG